MHTYRFVIALTLAALPSTCTLAVAQSLCFHSLPSEATQGRQGSVYIPVDSWVYPALLRFHALGYVDSLFLSIRPWTRRSMLTALAASQSEIARIEDEQAQELLDPLLRELCPEQSRAEAVDCAVTKIDSIYSRILGIAGRSLRDSYHLGQTVSNDYGRPYQPGLNALVGASFLFERGRISLYTRAEYQHAPAAAGYSQPLAAQLSGVDWIDPSGFNAQQSTLPAGPILSSNALRLVEGYASLHVAGHEVSAGKSDTWLGPAQGGATLWSNNAESLYALRIDRVDPLRIPLLSRLLGPLRYEFLYGSLKGHTAPNNPWVHAEIFSFAPTRDFQFAFGRSVIFGGKAHEPVTFGSFLQSFVSLQDVTPAVKDSPADPGARFSDFSFTWRLPYLRRYATLYADALAHDDVTPISAPRRASFRTGLYLAQLPHAPRWSLRVEAALTDPRVSVSNGGHFLYFESIQKQGYTNQGFLFGDAIGREGKGGEASLTYHLSGTDSLAVELFRKKNAKDFILGGTTQTSGKLHLSKRIHPNLELSSSLGYERWIAPVPEKETGLPLFQPTYQHDLAISLQVTFYPSQTFFRH